MLKIALVESGNKDFHKYVDAIPAKDIIFDYLFPKSENDRKGLFASVEEQKTQRIERPKQLFKEDQQAPASEFYHPKDIEKSSTMIQQV